MARKKTTKKRTPQRRVGEFRFKIEAFTPDTMPMGRLIEYLEHVAEILGEKNDVHLVAIETGSTVPVLKVAYEAIPKVQDRVEAVRRGDGPRDSQRSYQKVNEMLRADHGRAVLQRGRRGARILEFPGHDESEQTFANVKEFGSIDGEVIRIGGKGEDVPIQLETAEGELIAGCHTSRDVAKALAVHLWEFVRVLGTGYWNRPTEGEWELSHYRIADFEKLDDVPLGEAVTKLRAIEGEWDSNAYNELVAARQGRAANGGT